MDGHDDSVSAATNSGIPMGLEAVKKLDGYDDSVSPATNSGIPMGLEAVKKLDKQFLLTYLVS
ncbi:MAG: hypothetical protein WAK17_05265 [Candidatus Nitrosopolaris sp.]